MTQEMDSKIIIEKDGVKREVKFPFDLCLSRNAAHWLIHQLKQMDHEESGICGWITVAQPVFAERLANSKPKKWEE